MKRYCTIFDRLSNHFKSLFFPARHNLHFTSLLFHIVFSTQVYHLTSSCTALLSPHDTGPNPMIHRSPTDHPIFRSA